MVGVLPNALVIRAMSKILQRVSLSVLVTARICYCVERAGHHMLINVPTTADIISTVEFDSTGNYLATGDKGGRVVLFERNEMVSDFNGKLLPDCGQRQGQ